MPILEFLDCPLPADKNPELTKSQVSALARSCVEYLQADVKDGAKYVNIDDVSLSCLKVLAVLSREEANRAVLVDGGCLPQLVDVIRECKRTDDLPIQALRALANICIDNDEHRQAVANVDESIKSIVDFVGVTASQVTDLKSIEVEDAPQLSVKTAICVGTVINLCNENELMAQELLAAGALPHVLSIYSGKFVSDSVRMSALSALEALTEQDEGKLALCAGDYPMKLFDALVFTTDKEFEERPTELIESLVSDNEAMRQKFVETLGLSKLIALASQLSDPVGDVASRVLAIIFTDDKYMQLALDDSSLHVIDRLLEWCKSTDTTKRANAAFAFGNLARSESACQQLMDAGVSLQLISMLDSEDAREIHAIFGALRNLVIAKETRMALIDAGLLDKLPKWAESFHMPVRFLLVSILRTLASRDKEVGSLMADDERILGMAMQLVGSDDEGTSSEAARVIANIIKYSPKKEYIQTICEMGGLKGLNKLLTSKHMILQNDGLMALCLVGAIMGNSLVDVAYLEQCSRSVVNLSKSDEAIPDSIKQNCKQWLEIVAKNDALKSRIDSSERDTKAVGQMDNRIESPQQ
ncbi:hypothetical protein SARC_10302 [Sphaeroforma arctica JP610]|uniref:UNC-45/Cro1/She4 central domain-containing protein n=1 Tax=Sphaeroforma arctica JP610 TaxID=667725 RepID=A0A0L0FMH5_9EUKA|nr:hypothetical protein SARC_10302 [Sphaeroforma arctica JP610]KNC77233.1 hypothetical protein SARC_10302 [Sphaeroforma arctica JP610]|eukprot:XP_014151135.1 hypothetical protein SARC_10302 [Sphaeroforma arctica JP610]